MFKVNSKEARTTSTVSLFSTLFLTLPILVSLLLILNIFHMLQDVKNAEICALHWKKSKFNGLQIGPSNLSFLRIYVQGVLMGFYGDYN